HGIPRGAAHRPRHGCAHGRCRQRCSGPSGGPRTRPRCAPRVGTPRLCERGTGAGGHPRRRVKVAVVTDSAAALPASIADAHGVLVAPLAVADGNTAAPAPGAFDRVIAEQLASGAGAVVVVTP